MTENIDSAGKKKAGRPKKSADAPVERIIPEVSAEEQARMDAAMAAAMGEPAAMPLPTEEPEPAWDLETWAQICQAKLGVAKWVLAGALHGMDEDKEYSERELRKVVEAFLNRKIKS